MPWTLTTPINTGDLDAGTYAQVKIVRMAHDSVRGVIAVDLEYGNTDGEGVWKPGLAPRTKPSSVFIQGEDYDTLTGTATPESVEEKLYAGVKRGLYAFLASKGFIGAGEIAED